MGDYSTVEDLFKELDAKEFSFFARALGSYRKSLMDEGFTRREAIKLVESYSQFLYNMGLEDFIAERNREEDVKFMQELDDDDDDD